MPTFTFQDREGMSLAKPGDYICGIEVAKLAIAKSTGNEQIEVHVRPISQFDATTKKVVDLKEMAPVVWWYGGFSEKQQWGIDVFLKALQRAPKKGTELAIDDDWLNQNVRAGLAWATIGVEEFPAGSGKKKNTLVRWITTIDGSHPDPYKIYDSAAPKQDAETAEF